MAKRCLVDACKREAETYCYHCSQDVCGTHFLEHKKSTVEQLHPLIDDVNEIYDRIQHCDTTQTKPTLQCFVDAQNQLDKWRADSYHHIDSVYQRAQNQIEIIVEKHKQQESEKEVKNLVSLEEMRQQLKELLAEGDVTYRQLEAMKRQLDEVKRKEREHLVYPNIHIITQKLDVDKLVNIISDVKNPNEGLQKQVMTLPASSHSNSSLLSSPTLSAAFQKTSNKDSKGWPKPKKSSNRYKNNWSTSEEPSNTQNDAWSRSEEPNDTQDDAWWTSEKPSNRYKNIWSTSEEPYNTQNEARATSGKPSNRYKDNWSTSRKPSNRHNDD